jgi:hypothetical protein
MRQNDEIVPAPPGFTIAGEPVVAFIRAISGGTLRIPLSESQFEKLGIKWVDGRGIRE